jgi:hypothetical protein
MPPLTRYEPIKRIHCYFGSTDYNKYHPPVSGFFNVLNSNSKMYVANIFNCFSLGKNKFL